MGICRMVQRTECWYCHHVKQKRQKPAASLPTLITRRTEIKGSALTVTSTSSAGGVAPSDCATFHACTSCHARKACAVSAPSGSKLLQAQLTKLSQRPQTTRKIMEWRKIMERMGGSAPQTPAPAELPVNSSERRLETHSQSQQKTKHRGQRKQASWSWSQIKSLWQGLSLRTVHSANSTTHPQTNSRHGHKWGNAGKAGKTYYVESCAKFWRRRFRRKSPKNMGNSGADVAFEPERQQTSWHHHLSSS